MNRVMIIGCCGAGKSTLAKKIAKATGLDLIHLDQHYWQEGWVETPQAQWAAIVKELASRDSWIIDGNYGGTMDIREARADTIIFLDYPTVRCLYRVTKRVIKYHGSERPDMPKGCKERFDFEFFHYVAFYNLIHGKRHSEMLKRAKQSGKQVYILKNDHEIDSFLKRVDINEGVN